MSRKTRSKSDAEYLRKVGLEMRSIRRTNGMTQVELARSLNLSREGYSNYERGEREMSILTLRAFVRKTNGNPLELKNARVLANVISKNVVQDWAKRSSCRKPIFWRQMKEVRAQVLIARSIYDQQQYSALGRKFRNTGEFIFTCCTFAIWLRLLLPDINAGSNVYTGHENSELIIAFMGFAILFPFQCKYFFAFWRWSSLQRSV